MLLGKILDGDDAKLFIKSLSGTAQIYQISRRVLQQSCDFSQLFR